MRYIKLYFQFLKLQLKSITEYRMDFIIGLFSVLIGQLNIMILTLVIFTNMKEIAGFSVSEVFLMYGFYIFIKGIDHFYNDNIWSFAWNKIKDGGFITILLRPINPIFYIIMERMEVSGISEAIVGLIIIIVFGKKHNICLSVSEVIMLIVILLCGLIVFFAIKLLFSAPAFRTVTCGEFMTAGIEVSNSAKNPLTVYRNKFVKIILLYIFPFAISGYFPAVYVLKRKTLFMELPGKILAGNEIAVYSVIISLVLLTVSLVCWFNELKKFEPTGT